VSDKSAIEWTDATWNPVRGCSLVSPGCTNCYAMRQAHRSSGIGGAYEGLTKMSKGGPVWTGKVALIHKLLDAPLRWRRPRRIFVNSMSDLFHDDVPEIFIASVLGIAAACPHHTFQVLTKRPARMKHVLQCGAFLDAYESSLEMYTHAEAPWPPPNIWLGVSVEDQARADERIPLLLQTPAAVRWISAEPLLGPISFEGCWVEHPNPAIHENWLEVLNWVVVGGESGPGARPLQLDWVRSLRDQCHAVGTPFFLKQLGRWPIATKDEGYPWAQLHDEDGAPIGEWGLDGKSRKGGDPAEWPEDLRVRQYPPCRLVL